LLGKAIVGKSGCWEKLTGKKGYSTRTGLPILVLGAEFDDAAELAAPWRANLPRCGDAHVLNAASGPVVGDAGIAVYRFVPGQIGEDRIDISLLWHRS